MARQDPKEQQTPVEVTRKGEQGARSHERGLMRRGPYPLGFPLSPIDWLGATPFSLMRRMTEEMNRVFGEVGFGRVEEGMWSPPIEVTEQEGNLVVRAELAGVKPGDLKVETTDEAIVIQGERKSEREERKGEVQVSERRYGSFYRSIPLPQGAKSDEARAKFDNGVLEVTIPMQEQRKRREIPVEKAA